MRTLAPLAAVAGVVLLERASAWLLYERVGGALLASGPEVLLGATVASVCMMVRLVSLFAVATAVGALLGQGVCRVWRRVRPLGRPTASRVDSG